MAVCLARIGAWKGQTRVPVSLCSALGDDATGNTLASELEAEGVDISSTVRVPKTSSAVYSAMLSNDGQLVGAVMSGGSVFERVTVSPKKRYAITAVDCNLPEHIISQVCASRKSQGSEVWIEPVSVAKARRCVAAIRSGSVFGISPNQAELAELASHVAPGAASLEEQCQRLFDCGVRVILLKQGKEGVVVAEAGKKPFARFGAPDVTRIVSVSGAGDCLLAAFLYGRVRSLSLEATMTLANQVVARCLSTLDTVPQLAQ